MKKQLLFIVNPISGRGNVKNNLADIVDVFIKNGYEVCVHITQGKGDAKKLVIEKNQKFDLIICSGGDGTLSEVIAGVVMSDSQTKIGYIPTGTTNDFANSMGISRNMIDSATLSVTGEVFPCDIGKFNDSYFLYVSAFGLFTEIAYSTPQEMKNSLGEVAYFLQTIKSLSDIKHYRIKLWYDGEYIEDDFIYGMVANSKSVGGLKKLMTAEVDLQDGLFELLMVRHPKSLAELGTIVRHLIVGEENSEYILRAQASEIKILSETKIDWTLDGEFGGALEEVNVKNLKQAVKFIV